MTNRDETETRRGIINPNVSCLTAWRASELQRFIAL